MSRFGRRRDAEEEQRATSLELFYDLVFAFAVTQVSHRLLGHLTWAGAGEAAVVLLAAWWSWNYTTWVTNELDPESAAVRAMLIAVMLASLLMAVAIPEAFGADALLFACSYVAIQVGRHVFLAFAAAGRGTIERERAARILTWFALAGALWIAGALASGSARVALWLAALLVDYGAPLHLFWLPWRPRLTGATWDVETSHFTERFGGFIILALGESIIVTGATTSELQLDAATLGAFACAFLSTAALWWLYFDYVVVIAQRQLALSADRTRLARDAYTYLHVLIVAGVIVSAVGDGVVIAHPTQPLGAPELAVAVAGPALYLLAHVALRLRMTGTVSIKRMTGVLGCGAAGAIGAVAPGLAVAGLLLATLTGVIVAERISEARRRARGVPSPLERVEAAHRAGGRLG